MDDDEESLASDRRQSQTTGTNGSAAQSGLELPRDGRLISLLLAANEVALVESQVIPLLLDLAWKTTVETLQEAVLYAEHRQGHGLGQTVAAATAAEVGMEDLRMALEARSNHQFVPPPPKGFLLHLAGELNARPLPPIPERAGPRLPPVAHQLTAVNFDLEPDQAVMAQVKARKRTLSVLEMQQRQQRRADERERRAKAKAVRARRAMVIRAAKVVGEEEDAPASAAAASPAPSDDFFGRQMDVDGADAGEDAVEEAPEVRQIDEDTDYDDDDD